MEEWYSLIAQNWMEYQQLMLDFTLIDISSQGACACLFSRTEQQKDLGNFPHEHTILALKKDTLSSLDYNQLNNLIATNIMDIVKPDQVAKYTADSLLSCPEDVDDIIQEGWRELKHTCSERYLVIGIGDGPENYRYCKQHGIKDTPDPTSHNLIRLPCKVSHMFFIHILLTHEKYFTELDILHHRLKNAHLIGRERDDKSLQFYSSNLLQLYILNELQYHQKWFYAPYHIVEMFFLLI
jgi:hypothetical protein